VGSGWASPGTYLYLLDALTDPDQVGENIAKRMLTRQHLTVRAESG
jgi:hypothetical protein